MVLYGFVFYYRMTVTRYLTTRRGFHLDFSLNLIVRIKSKQTLDVILYAFHLTFKCPKYLVSNMSKIIN